MSIARGCCHIACR